MKFSSWMATSPEIKFHYKKLQQHQIKFHYSRKGEVHINLWSSYVLIKWKYLWYKLTNFTLFYWKNDKNWQDHLKHSLWTGLHCYIQYNKVWHYHLTAKKLTINKENKNSSFHKLLHSLLWNDSVMKTVLNFCILSI